MYALPFLPEDADDRQRIRRRQNGQRDGRMNHYGKKRESEPAEQNRAGAV
jgi:hypothetical protein